MRERFDSFLSFLKSRPFVSSIVLIIVLSAVVAFAATNFQDINVSGNAQATRMSVSTFTDYTQVATPANPSSGHDRLYFKNDDSVYYLNSVGTETKLLSGNNAANRFLSNLDTPTAINQDLLFGADGTYLIGNGTTNSASGIFAYQIGADITSGVGIRDFAAGGTPVFTISPQTLPDGTSGTYPLRSGSSSVIAGQRIAAVISRNFSGTTDTGMVTLQTGNATGASNNSGDIKLRIGTVSGGTRGGLYFIDGSEGTSGECWVSTGSSGQGHWDPCGANTSLSNLTTTSINQDLLPDSNASKNIGSSSLNWLTTWSNVFESNTSLEVITQDKTGSNNSDLINIESGSVVDGTSGAVSLKSGASSVTGTSGPVSVFSGTNDDGDTGALSMGSGLADVGNSGNASLISGQVTTGDSGTVSFATGNVTNTGNSGNGSFVTGDVQSGTSGQLSLTTGNISLSGSSGAINIETGAATAASGVLSLTTGDTSGGNPTGNISIQTGTNSGGNASGSVSIASGNGVSASGDITLQTGTGAGRGGLYFIDGSEGTAGECWVSTGTGGKGNWDTCPVGLAANRALSNLTTTSVNQDLIPSAAGKFLGSVSTPWSALLSNEIYNYNSGTNYVSFTHTASPSSNTFFHWRALSTEPVGMTTISTGGATNSQPLRFETGNNTGSGNTGAIILRTGTISGGIRGDITFIDGTEGTTGDCWRSQGTGGEGGWQACPGGGSVDLTTDVTGVLPLINGGTNKAMTASNGAVVYSDADSFEFTSVGSSGQILQSGGAGAPTWSTATFPSTATGTGKVLRADGTNWVASTATFPDTATSTGTILRANGTNWVATTATYPTTTTANRILYSSANDTIGEITSAATSALVTNASSVPTFTSGTTANRLLRTDGTTVSFAQASLTTDVTGTLPIANGGTNATATPTNGGVAYGTGSAYAFTSAGTSGQFLQSAGAASPTWVTGYIWGSRQVFTASGTWTKPSGTRAVFVRLCGGGGAGGGAATTSAGQLSNGGGGGAGGYSEELITSLPNGTETVTIGAGGTGVAGGTGNSGGTTSFDTYLQATGGSGGTASSASTGNRVTAGSAGGVGSSGDVNASGGQGGGGFSNSTITFAQGGTGGGSIYGTGGTNTYVATTSSAGAAATSTTYCAGGGGAANGTTGNTQVAGGAGAGGIVIVDEYY